LDAVFSLTRGFAKQSFTMLLRIFLVIAILAGIAVTVLNFLPVKDKITAVMAERAEWHGKYDTTFADLNKTKSELSKTKTDLEGTRKTLADTKQERDNALTEAGNQKKAAQALDTALKDMTAKWKATDQELSAWGALGISVEQVRATVSTNKELVAVVTQLGRDKQLLQNQVIAKEQELMIYRDPDYNVPLPPDLIGKVVAVDPKYDFVVLNVGQRQGVLTHGQMLVSRDGKLVAKIRIKEVEPDRAIANVVPGWKLTDVYEGDNVVTR
jgi:hypothetical protein